LLLTVNFHIAHCNNCAYNRCEYRKSPSSYSGHAACLGTGLNYNLIRTIECHNENYHVCCRDPLRQDIQQSRQAVFRQIAELGQVLSENCTRLVLCEQPCKDRVNSLFERADYPYIMADDNNLNGIMYWLIIVERNWAFVTDLCRAITSIVTSIVTNSVMLITVPTVNRIWTTPCWSDYIIIGPECFIKLV